eukprot:1147995-Pelagomonas_calceolata.AAC.20
MLDLRSGQPIIMREFVVDLRKMLRGVWHADALAEHGGHTDKLAKYHHWMALPLRPLCDQGGHQDEKHAMLLCSCDPALSTSLKLAVFHFLLSSAEAN